MRGGPRPKELDPADEATLLHCATRDELRAPALGDDHLTVEAGSIELTTGLPMRGFDEDAVCGHHVRPISRLAVTTRATIRHAGGM